MQEMGNRLRKTPKYKALLEGLRAGHDCLASGLWGSSYAYLGAELAQDAPATVLVVGPTLDAADNATIDFRFFIPKANTLAVFPAWEALPSEEIPSNREILSQRLALLSSLATPPAAQPSNPTIIFASVQALQQPVIDPATLASSTLRFRMGDERPMDNIAKILVERGFERLPQIEAPGQFSIRGGILDIFSMGTDQPVRIEFFGDTMDSIRCFDPSTQLSTESRSEVQILAVSETLFHHLKASGHGCSLFDYLPSDTWVFVREPAEVQERAERLLESAVARKELYAYSALHALWRQRPVLQMTELPERQRKYHSDFTVRSVERFSGQLSSLAQELAGLAQSNEKVVVACHNEGERARLKELLAGSKLLSDSRLELRLGALTRGFEMDDVRTAFVSHPELFKSSAPRLRPERLRGRSIPIEDWMDLKPGDFVVHMVHGIGRYLGLERLDRNEERGDFLSVEFAEKTRVFVPVTHIDLVQKYMGPTRTRPSLSRTGALRWTRKKQDAKDAIEDLALELLKIQAVRELSPGTQFPPDTEWQREFEAAFPFEATEDQLSGASAIKEDMEKPRPMDRLLCGDVGYGKTEVSMRAAFKAVMYGKQVAILAPTTVLAHQHYRTFTERMADYPVTIEVISRFRSKQEQKEILEQIKTGAVDILIGTHRLVQQDVEFRDLGLLVIDEEQRFGVLQKEFLKRVRQTVDVLTMTATPIPRTLHMSLLGIRDISALNTPPPDRQSIHTEICRFDPRLIRDAIQRELRRGGQVYFVHNRVHNIEPMAARLAEIVPEARIVIGHGQMPEGELEACMTDFVNGRYDILVCTTIIGSGLDIPNVNTIFIHDAEIFGLAELHQLRGRVGRYKHRAYAYFLLPEERPITPKALRRLKAIEEFCELGAGFKIAMRDLEIRGTGNILGPKQSGHIGAVGYELYCRLLDITVRQIKKQPLVIPIDVRVELGLDAFLPDEYVPGDRQRMEIYRRLARSHDLQQITEVEAALVDRFGPLPQPVRYLFLQHRLRILAQPWEIHYIRRLPDRVEFRCLRASETARDLKLPRKRVRTVDSRTVHVLLSEPEQEGEDLGGFLCELLAAKKQEIPEGAVIVSSALLEGLRPPRTL